MKHFIYILMLALVLFSCSEERTKPDPLLSEKQMEDMIYDVSLLQSIRSFSPKVLDSNRVDPKVYIYKKYNIDSAAFAQNNAYYAADLELYEKIQERVIKRLTQKRDSLKPKTDTVANKTDGIVNPRLDIDSIKKSMIERKKSRLKK